MIQLFLGAKFPLNSSGPLHILNKITMLIIVKREMLINKVFSLSLLRIYCIKKLVFPLFKKKKLLHKDDNILKGGDLTRRNS